MKSSANGGARSAAEVPEKVGGTESGEHQEKGQAQRGRGLVGSDRAIATREASSSSSSSSSGSPRASRWVARQPIDGSRRDSVERRSGGRKPREMGLGKQRGTGWLGGLMGPHGDAMLRWHMDAWRGHAWGI
eukprot:365573-Chlamydomonas_euryale.AAC.12